MRTEVIKADSIEEAAERILDELKEDPATRSVSTRSNVIYFDGWDGLGASAILRAVAHRLTALASSSDKAPAGLQFDQVIHVDCSKWDSRRSLQRAVAEQLELPALVMDMFDRQDEEDDFNGIAKGSRTEIPQVVRKMYEHIQKLNHRFLVIFHNGSNEDVDLGTFCGFPLSGYSTNKVLWTFQGAFRLKPRMKVDDALKMSTGVTDVFLSASGHNKDPQELWNYLVHQEAADVASMITTTRAAAETTSAQTVSTYYVANYFLYMWKLCGMAHHFRLDYDMATHGGNYWICDGVKQLEQGHQTDIGNGCDADGPWRAAAAVQQDLRLDLDYYHHSMQSLPYHLMRCADSTASMPYWTSPPHWVLFSSTGDTLLQHFSKLGVLKLSRCTFSFSSPPFLGCRNLRLLWLDHCQDQAISKDGTADTKWEDIQHCFKRLWVLDVRYTRCDQILSSHMLNIMAQLRELNVIGAQDLDIGQLHGRLPNICKLRVKKSTVHCSGHSEQDLFQGMNKMELLDFSGNQTMQGVTEFSEISTSNNCLGTVMITDGCAGIRKFSFRECSKLKNLLFSGLFEDLCILDFSGTSVKTLDLSAMTPRSLDELILDNCDKLCAILWPPEDKRKRYMQKLHIDTTQSASTSRSGKGKMKVGSTTATESSSSSWPMILVNGAQPPSQFNRYISIKDTRLLRSFEPTFQNYFGNPRVHLEISSPSYCAKVNVDGSENERIKNKTGEEPQLVVSNRQHQQPQYNNNASMYYADVAVIIVEQHLLQGGEGNGNDAPTITRTRPCPPPSERLGSSDCFVYTQDLQMNTKADMDGGATATIPSIICDRASILHVHDSLYNTSIPGSSQWNPLRWCRVERCPRLDFIFTAPQLGGGSNVRMCWCLRTFWASQLPRTRFMWDTSKLSLTQIRTNSFEELQLLHLDFCPRLIQVLPFTSSEFNTRYLETVEIVWCGDLRVVFPLLDTNVTESHQEKQQKPPGAIITMMDFPSLKHIHLHELPKMESICGLGRMYAPKLETIKIRGCWSLKHLPAVSNNRSNNKVECDCEKEWWDKLEWDGLDGKHHPSLYRTVHSRYYKKKLLRGSVLI